MRKRFKAVIYKTGINPCVDVPASLTAKMTATKGYIPIKGTINKAEFTQTLVPVKNGPYRLFVNAPMLKKGNTSVGEEAVFAIEQNLQHTTKEYTISPTLLAQLKTKKLLTAFQALTDSRKKEILKYLAAIKTETTLQRNIGKLLHQLESKSSPVRIP